MVATVLIPQQRLTAGFRVSVDKIGPFAVIEGVNAGLAARWGLIPGGKTG
jgi:hypothetical protein